MDSLPLVGFLASFPVHSERLTSPEACASSRSHQLSPSSSRTTQRLASMNSQSSSAKASHPAPLLVRAARGEKVERTPVWMMRQAGRYLPEYRELAKKHPSFRERSENPELAIEVSLQPWRRFRPDGVIMFSDILTPLPGMGIDFDIVEKTGPVIFNPVRNEQDIDKIHSFDPSSRFGFIGEILQGLHKEVKGESAILGFAGAPYTMATYVVEGGTSKTHAHVKTMAYTTPHVLQKLLTKLSDSIAEYIMYQIEQGAEAVQLFDSWAGQLSPEDFSMFALPYQQRVVRAVKAKYPNTPFILYCGNSAACLPFLADVGADVVSLDWTVDMAQARNQLGPNQAVQGNLDPAVLFGSTAEVERRVKEILRKAGPHGHIMNLGHGVLVDTPVENVAKFFSTTQEYRHLN